MYVIDKNDGNIYATRGDIVVLSVSADDNGKPYTFQAGEVLRIKVFGKKDAESVVLQKDFPITTATQNVELFLDENDTKIGEVISKPRDYWYEIELNPFDNPQTIIGYDEDGPKIFRLFPEGADIPPYVPDPEDIPIIDTELDMTSDRPVANQVIARAFSNLQAGYQATHEAVAKLHITPQMFGAIGDGVADDTEAVRTAFSSGCDVFFPAGTYKISDTIVVSNYARIYGAGMSESIIKYTGNGFLFDVSTSYTNNAVIENMRFDGGAASFLKCSMGKWGAKVIVRNSRVEGFSKEVFHFASCFNPIVENCFILTDGKIVFTTYNGTITETNFTNCAQFLNVYISSYSGTRTPVMFDMTNVRDISFHKCQLETTDLLLSEVEKTVGVSLYNCWLENVGAIYKIGANCSEPSVDNCNYVNVGCYNADAGAIDFLSGRGIILQNSTGTSGLKAMIENSVILEQVNIYNANDGYSQYTPAYKIATDGTDFNQPLNKRSVHRENTSWAAIDLKPIVRYSGVGCVFNIVARILYTDDSYKIIESKVLYLDNGFYTCDIKALKVTKWESSVSSTATETITCTDGVVKLETSASMRKCDLMINFNFNQV